VPFPAHAHAQLLKQVDRWREAQQAAGRDQQGGVDAPPVEVRAQLAVLAQQWPVAESLLLAQGKVEDAVAAYKGAHR
jgi:hypothetical protein